MSKVLTTLVTVVVAVGVSAGIWIVANLVFNQARNRWQAFSAMCFAAIGFLIGAVLSGNRLTVGSPSADQGGFLDLSSGCRSWGRRCSLRSARSSSGSPIRGGG